MSGTCERCASAIEPGDLRCSICALPVPVAREAPSAREHAQLLRCEECGAAVAYSPAHAAPACAFCGRAMRVEQPSDAVEAATLRVPFAVARLEAELALRGWLATRGFFTPATLRDEAVLDTLHPLCWAAWIVDATAAVAWTADSDQGARRSAWAPHAGEAAMHFDGLCVPASRGLALDECAALVGGYDLARAVPVEAGDPLVDGEVIEAFELRRSAARHLVQRALEARAVQRVEAFIPGRRKRKVHVACLLESQTTRRVALPVWVLAYRYRDRPYRAIVHGQRSTIVVGSMPKDWEKIRRLALVVLAVIAVIAAIAAR